MEWAGKEENQSRVVSLGEKLKKHLVSKEKEDKKGKSASYNYFS